LVEGDLVDTALVFRALTDNGVEAVIHMAGDALVPESMEQPARYYRNNLIAGLSLLDAMRDAGVTPIVFSSTCAVYGVPERTPLDERMATNPDQSVRRIEAGLRARARMVPPRPRLQGGRAPLFQCRRRGSDARANAISPKRI
jgi:nucleoside-diphosphate-sugar epimerase